MTYFFILSGAVTLCTVPYLFIKGLFADEKGAFAALILFATCIAFIYIGVRGVQNEISEYKDDSHRRKK